MGTHLGAQPGARDADISLDLLPRAVSSTPEDERRVELKQAHSGALVADLIIDLERLQKKAAARAAAKAAVRQRGAPGTTGEERVHACSEGTEGKGERARRIGHRGERKQRWMGVEGYGEMRGDAGRYGEIRGDAGSSETARSRA